MSADAFTSPDDLFSWLLAACDDSLATDVRTLLAHTVAIPPDLRHPLEEDAQWCRLVRRLLRAQGKTQSQVSDLGGNEPGLLADGAVQKDLAAALAKLSGLSKQALSNLEAGNREPRWQKVQLLAHALGVDCTAFIDPELQPPEAEPARPRGRPRKDAGQVEPAPAKKAKKRKS